MNEILSPAAISGIGTPVITQHLPPGAISYVNGEVIVNTTGAVQTGAVQTGGRRKRKVSRRRTTRRKTIKKVRKHRRSMKKKSLRRRKY